jgi:hypothetical protein
MNCADMAAKAVIEHELDHIALTIGPEPEKDIMIFQPKLWLNQHERLTIVRDYFNERLEQLSQ